MQAAMGKHDDKLTWLERAIVLLNELGLKLGSSSMKITEASKGLAKKAMGSVWKRKND